MLALVSLTNLTEPSPSEIGSFYITLFTIAYVLIVYHVVLVVKIMFQKTRGFSMPIGQTILTHVACVGVALALALLRSEHIPFVWLIRFFVPGLAPFEAMWLFSGKASVYKSEPESVTSEVSPEERLSPTAEEHEAFLEQMRKGVRPFRKPGRSLQEEMHFWLIDRRKKQAPAAMKMA